MRRSDWPTDPEGRPLVVVDRQWDEDSDHARVDDLIPVDPWWPTNYTLPPAEWADVKGRPVRWYGVDDDGGYMLAGWLLDTGERWPDPWLIADELATWHSGCTGIKDGRHQWVTG